MKEKTRERMEKFVALCNSGKPWYVFLAMFSILLAASALVELFTDQRMKWWAWALNIVGILDSMVNICRCKKLNARKAEEESA